MAAKIKQQITYPTGRTETFDAVPVSHVVAIQVTRGGRWEIWGGHGDRESASREAAYLACSRFAGVKILPVTRVHTRVQ